MEHYPADSPTPEAWLDSLRDARNQGGVERARELARSIPASLRAHPVVRVALGELAIWQNDLDRAETELAMATRDAPGRADAWHDLGVIAQWRHDYLRSIDCLRRAMALAPEARHSATALAHSLFAAGHYDEGWEWFEHRAGGQADLPRQRGLWDGSRVPHAALAIFAEEGLGDVIQFCRFVDSIRDRVARVLLVLDPPCDSLLPLLASLRGVDQIVTDRKSGPLVHAHCPVMSIARFARASTENPGVVPYLAPPPERLELWRRRLGESQRLRVGLVWAGSSRSDPGARDADLRRSIDPALLGPLFAVPDVEWHSLQLGDGRARRGRLPPGVAIIDHAEEIRDFGDTAALIASLDLLVTVDTSAAHVAGAIGAPVFMLNRFDTDWRWGMEGERTPWYPTMRIFRQHAFCDWRGALGDAAAALARWRRP
jgi:hypothetical protein